MDMSRSAGRRWWILLCVLIAGSLGCSARSERKIQPVEQGDGDQQLGSLHLPLVTPDAEQYRLRGAIFDISKLGANTSVSLDSDSDTSADSLDAQLAQGQYSITLKDGWHLERAGDAGASVTVSASLLTANPLQFNIDNARVTEIVYSFTTDQGTITFGRGALSVSIDVSSNAPLGDCSVLDRGSCPSGQTCLLSGDSGHTYCAQAGKLAVGDDCSSEQCVAGAQCLALDPAHPEARSCVRFCNPSFTFCGCQAIVQAPGVGVCTEATPLGVVFEHAFGNPATDNQSCSQWSAFQSQLTAPSYVRVAMAGSLGGAIECTDPNAATSICNAMRTGQFANISCQNHTWTANWCSTELAVDSPFNCGCSNPGNILRPCSSTWGGVGTNTCNNVPQAIQVTCDPLGPRCGDGVVNGSEECDGSAGLGVCPAGTHGPVRCTSACKRDTSGCLAGAGPSAACEACTNSNCLDLINACDTEDNLPQSPIGACRTVLACMQVGFEGLDHASCAQTDTAACYCGTTAGGAVDIAACLGGTSNGACKDVIRSQAGCASALNEAQCILSHQNDTDYGYGDAAQIVNCQRNNCFSECGLDP